MDDIRIECETHGQVIDISIPRMNQLGQGRVFVEFETIQGAQMCMTKINGKKFGDSTVKVYFFDEILYQKFLS